MTEGWIRIATGAAAILIAISLILALTSSLSQGESLWRVGLASFALILLIVGPWVLVRGLRARSAALRRQGSPQDPDRDALDPYLKEKHRQEALTIERLRGRR
jgi:ABC-type nickel/cobalt efflux system permease component RcnA